MSAANCLKLLYEGLAIHKINMMLNTAIENLILKFIITYGYKIQKSKNWFNTKRLNVCEFIVNIITWYGKHKARANIFSKNGY